MRVLLTGAAGFIGTAVSDALEAAGHDVVRVDALVPQAHAAGTDAGTDAGDLHVLDVRDAARWPRVLDDVDVVCHQAALVGAGTDPADLPAYASINDLGTAALLAAMHGAGVRRLVLASSMVVYGEGRYACADHGDQAAPPRTREQLEAGCFDVVCPLCGSALDWELVEETARLDPRSSYAASKVAQEHYSSAWARQAEGSAIALRYHNVYGPGMPRDTPYSGVAAMFRSAAARGEPPQVFEDGRQMRDFVHVQDVSTANVRAIEEVLERPPGGWSAYNVCSGRPVSIADVAAHVAGAGPGPVVSGRFRLGDVRHVVASPHLAEVELGFRAQVSPAEGLRQFATAPLRGAASPACGQ